MKKGGRNCGAFYYADDGLVASTEPNWLKGAFDTLTGLFNIMGLQKNVCETSGMV